jgi:hypothetical protein
MENYVRKQQRSSNKSALKSKWSLGMVTAYPPPPFKPELFRVHNNEHDKT